MKELKLQAINEYKELKSKVESYKGSLEDLCKELEGHNLDTDLFDVNYKSICGTVCKFNNKLELMTGLEIWDDSECSYVGTFDIEELEKEDKE